MNLKYCVVWVLPSAQWVEVSFEVTHIGLENAIEFANEYCGDVFVVKRLTSGQKVVELQWSYKLQSLDISTS